jgi:superoxide dismutase
MPRGKKGTGVKRERKHGTYKDYYAAAHLKRMEGYTAKMNKCIAGCQAHFDKKSAKSEKRLANAGSAPRAKRQRKVKFGPMTKKAFERQQAKAMKADISVV